MPADILLRCGAMGDLNDLQPLTGLSLKRRPGNKPPWRWIVVGLGVAGAVTLLFTSVPGKIKRGLGELIHGPAPKPWMKRT